MDFQGFEVNTFSIVARCERTGMLGVCQATHAYAVGARCPWVRAGVGAVATQAITDPRLGRLALNLLDLGYSAPRALAEVAASDPHFAHRQVGIVDRDGQSAAQTGSANKDWAGHVTRKNFVAMGNFLISARTVEAMAESFEKTPDLELDERLLRAVEAGRDAGGQHKGQRSAALVVHYREVFPWVDLRVDAHDEPVGELRRIFALFQGVKEYMTLRVPDPELPQPPDA
jgi:uncharacterized Ntn-hydrolase superfamily protein